MGKDLSLKSVQKKVKVFSAAVSYTDDWVKANVYEKLFQQCGSFPAFITQPSTFMLKYEPHHSETDTLNGEPTVLT